MRDESLGRWIAHEVALPVHHGRQHLSGHHRCVARRGGCAARPPRRLARAARILHAMGDRKAHPAGRSRLGHRWRHPHDDVPAFERAKLRLLNCAHSTLAYLGLLAGSRQWPRRSASRPRRLHAQDARHRSVARAAPGAWSGSHHLRGHRPAPLSQSRILHELAQIAWDGSQKLPFRVLGTVLDALTLGRSIDNLFLPLVAWMLFVRWAAQQQVPSSIRWPGALLSSVPRGPSTPPRCRAVPVPARSLQRRSARQYAVSCSARACVFARRRLVRASAQCLSAAGSHSDSCGNNTTSSSTASAAR